MLKINNLKRMFGHKKRDVQSYKHSHFLNNLPRAELEEILLFSEADQLPAMVPQFANKRTLFFNDQRHKFIFKKLLAKEPEFFLNYIFANHKNAAQGVGHYSVGGSIHNLSIKKDYFDVAICPFTLVSDFVDDRVIGNIAAVLKNGGRMVLSLRHTQLEHILYNQNPTKTQVLNNTLSNYYRILKQHGLFLEDLQEGLVDKSLKPFFGADDDSDYYHEYRGTPITLLMRAVKFIKSK